MEANTVKLTSYLGERRRLTLQLNRAGLVTLEPALLLPEQDGPVSVAANPGEAIELTVHFSRQDSVFALPAFEVICELLHRREIGCATALLGLDGSARGHRQRSTLFGRGDAPVMIAAVGSAGLISSVLPELAGLLRYPVITLTRVRLCKRDGALVGLPAGPPAEDRRGLASWQKLTVYTLDTGQHGQPVHRAIVRQLRSAGIGGVTVHRGMWGFHGDQLPHGDRLRPWGRHVPVITSVIDTADNIPRAFDIIDQLTGRQGLVTCENILVMRTAALLP